MLSDLGAEIDEVNAEVDWMSDDQRVLYLCSIANNLGQVVDRFGDKTDPVLQAYVAAGKKYDIARLHQSCGRPHAAVPRGSGPVREL